MCFEAGTQIAKSSKVKRSNEMHNLKNRTPWNVSALLRAIAQDDSNEFLSSLVFLKKADLSKWAWIVVKGLFNFFSIIILFCNSNIQVLTIAFLIFSTAEQNINPIKKCKFLAPTT